MPPKATAHTTGAALRPEAIEMFREIFLAEGLPAEKSQAVLSRTANWLEGQLKQEDRDVAAEMQRAWGPDAERKLYLARDTARTLGLDPKSAAAIEAAIGSGFPLIDLFHRIGERFEAGPVSAERSTDANGSRQPEPKRSDPVNDDDGLSTSAELKKKLVLYMSDPEVRLAFFDSRHPRNKYVNEERTAIIERLAQAQAAEAKAERTTVVTKRETERDRLKRDPEFSVAMKDPRHWRHQEFQSRWEKLIEAEVGAKGDPAKALRADLDNLTRDTDVRKAIIDPQHPRHQEAVTRRARLIEDHLATATPSSTPVELPPSSAEPAGQ